MENSNMEKKNGSPKENRTSNRMGTKVNGNGRRNGSTAIPKGDPQYSKPWSPPAPLNATPCPQNGTRRIFTIKIGPFTAWIRDVIAIVLMIKLMSAL